MRHGACLHNGMIYSQHSESIFHKLLTNKAQVQSTCVKDVHDSCSPAPEISCYYGARVFTGIVTRFMNRI
jgi:hypothetical protein